MCAGDHRKLETLGIWNTCQGNPQSREEAVWEREGWSEIHKTAGLQLPKPFEAHSTPPCVTDARPASTVKFALLDFSFTLVPSLPKLSFSPLELAVLTLCPCILKMFPFFFYFIEAHS